ncbi:hypothetical protein LIER_03727 [Lithospermum erythrorhizon]|uniref:Uncharacterized protein n=1 Tax=Lithospermum erythrorhizon TaxID=34254 RepID=A0AAV3NUB8_LITER
MFQLRQTVRPYVEREVRNGRSTNCLFDKWHSEEIPANLLTEKNISSLRIDVTDCIAQVVEKIKWPTGKAHNDRIQRFKDGFPALLRVEDHRLLSFGLGYHKSTHVGDSLRNKPGHVRW